MWLPARVQQTSAQLPALLRDVFSYLALQLADKFQLNSRANEPPDEPDLARAAVLGHKNHLATGDKRCKAPSAGG